jgi:hypothetical protein
MELHQIISRGNTVSALKKTPASPELLFAEMLCKKAAGSQITGDRVTSAKAEPVAIGTITRDNPTVSHLLVNHPDYKKDCWRIIHADINQNKPFTCIRAGETIYIDPATREITWGKEQAPEPMPVINDRTPNTDTPDESLSTRLMDAVKPFIGTSHNKVDCYELVVKGIKALGYRYHGQAGIKSSLMERALHDRLPVNAYLTGEGLMEKTGRAIVSKSFENIGDPAQAAMAFVREIQPLLRQGRILSFSTRTKGHTGVISKSENQWTFINSGRMDNAVGKSVNVNEVGEEFLTDEIENWFARAKKQKEPLKITIGALDQEKLAMFM